jgi:hypothetical protein
VYVQQCTQLTGTNSQALDRIDPLLASNMRMPAVDKERMQRRFDPLPFLYSRQFFV